MTVLYKDPKRPINERVADLLARMTPEEKFAQMHAYWLVLSEDGQHRERSDMSDEFARTRVRTSLSERLMSGVGQITRPLGTHIVDAVTGVRAANRLQKMLLDETRLGIPALFHEECLVGLLCKDATLFPSSLNYGSTWDPQLVRCAAQRIGEEARSTGWTYHAMYDGGGRKRRLVKIPGLSASWHVLTLRGCRAKLATCWRR